MFTIRPLLITTFLLRTTFSTVYHVMPDDHYTTNNNTYTLQHYLNNVNKYFTSHTQLHFLPGQYYLNTDLIIQHVSNLSLIGNRTNEVINSVIKCTSPAGIVVVGSSNIVIANIVMEECGNDYDHFFENTAMTSLLVLNCHSITILNFHVIYQEKHSYLTFINIISDLTLIHIITNNLKILYHNVHTNSPNNITFIYIYQLNVSMSYKEDLFYGMELTKVNSSISTTATFMYLKFNGGASFRNIFTNCSGYSNLCLKKCTFSDCGVGSFPYQIFSTTIYINYIDCNSNRTAIKLIDCYFIGFKKVSLVLLIVFSGKNQFHTEVHVIRCIFSSIFTMMLAKIKYQHQLKQSPVLVFINNVTMSHIFAHLAGINVNNVNITIQNMYIENTWSTQMITVESSSLTLHGYINVFNNTMTAFIAAELIYLKENVMLNFTSNSIYVVIQVASPQYPVAYCPIQYITDNTNLDKAFNNADRLRFSVLFKNNQMQQLSNVDSQSCIWSSASAFVTTRPSQINKHFIHFINTSFITKSACLCSNNETVDCNQEQVGPFFPGENVTMHLSFKPSRMPNFSKAVMQSIDARHGSPISCNINPIQVVIKLNECKSIRYLLKHANKKMCILSLILYALPLTSLYKRMELYTVLLQPCPAGFSLHPQGYCQCDPILSSRIPSLTTCDINHQTIPRPANTWISAHTINNSHSYHVSQHCPFDYCLPHLSQLNLSTPDSQCQFNRSGVLCGQCQHGLSTVFGSSQCKHCSDIYLLITLPIGISGVLLVLVLFSINLTTTDGRINSFLFYTNIVGINYSTIFYSTNKSVMYALISLANLDLGIESCFYNGMDDYAKMWLQLLFPMYLIFIATLLIITSRYSITIQRLTARRALSVLATLFLLSYTKVLQTVSNILFSYTSITHLPSNHTTLVWSVDTSVPLFGVKFTILFIACLILFLILIPFNVVLIFTKLLSRYKIVTYFKPLLDAYQGPYKIAFYYWTGLQLLIRAIFFGLSAFNHNVNLAVSITLLGIIIWLQEKNSPFKNTFKNKMELFSLLNLNVLFIMSIFTTSYSFIIFNVSVALAMIQLISVTLFQIFKSQKHTIMFLKIVDIVSCIKLKFRFTSSLDKSRKAQQNIELINTVPDVSYNYEEFQEPLVGISK